MPLGRLAAQSAPGTANKADRNTPRNASSTVAASRFLISSDTGY